MSDERTVFLIAHTGREAALRSVEGLVHGLLKAGVRIRLLASEAVGLDLPEGVERVSGGHGAADGCELILVAGGDGTLLRGALQAKGIDPNSSATIGSGVNYAFPAVQALAIAVTFVPLWWFGL